MRKKRRAQHRATVATFAKVQKPNGKVSYYKVWKVIGFRSEGVIKLMLLRDEQEHTLVYPVDSGHHFTADKGAALLMPKAQDLHLNHEDMVAIRPVGSDYPAHISMKEYEQFGLTTTNKRS
jgi:hypothetical protein